MAMIFSIIAPSVAHADAVKPAVTGADSMYGSRIKVEEPQALQTLSGVTVNGVSYSRAADENEVKNGAWKYFVKSDDRYVYISKLAKGDTVVLKAEPKSISFQIDRPADYFDIIDESTLQWIENAKFYKVVFKTLVEGQLDSETEVEEGKHVLAPSENPVRPGYTFEGWNTQEDGMGTPWSSSFVVNEETTFYAVWRAVVEKVTVTFDMNDGTGKTEDREIVKGEKIGDLPAPSRDGYIFRGWFMEKKQPGEVLTADPITADDTFDENTTVYAYWLKINVLTGDSVITKGEEAKYMIDLPATEELRLTLNVDPIPDSAWSMEAGAEPNTTIITLKPEYTRTLPAAEKAYELLVLGESGWGSMAEISVREPKVFTVAFDAQGGSPAPDDQEIQENHVLTQPAKPKKQNFVFDGWYRGDAKWNFDEPVTENMTLTAKWTPVNPDPKPPVNPGTDPKPPVNPGTDPKPQGSVKNEAGKPAAPSVDKTVTVTKSVTPGKKTAPKTGDSMPLFAAVGALAIATAGMIAVERKRKQSK